MDLADCHQGYFAVGRLARRKASVDLLVKVFEVPAMDMLFASYRLASHWD